MSGFDLGGVADFLSTATTSISNVAGKIADAKFGWQSRDLDLKLKNAELANATNQIKIQKTVSDAGVVIAKLEAQNAIKQAQQGYDGISSLNADNIGQAIANLNARITGQNSGPNYVLWLTVAGVGIAALQYFKKGG